MTESTFGYKGFTVSLSGELVCRDTVYNIGTAVKYSGDVAVCSSGYHYCPSFKDVLKYYPISPTTVYGRVMDTGTQRSVGDDKVATDELTLVELLEGTLEDGVTYSFHRGYVHGKVGHITYDMGQVGLSPIATNYEVDDETTHICCSVDKYTQGGFVSSETIGQCLADMEIVYETDEIFRNKVEGYIIQSVKEASTVVPTVAPTAASKGITTMDLADWLCKHSTLRCLKFKAMRKDMRLTKQGEIHFY